jgi:hypothetical protein
VANILYQKVYFGETEVMAKAKKLVPQGFFTISKITWKKMICTPVSERVLILSDSKAMRIT